MNFKDIRIVFMGTPEFAVASLAKLVDASAKATGSKIVVPKFVLSEWIKAYNAKRSLPKSRV